MLGRYYDTNTATWRFRDESGEAIPAEVMQEAEEASREQPSIGGLCVIFEFIERKALERT